MNSSYFSSVNCSDFSVMILGSTLRPRALRIGIDPVTMSVIILNLCDFWGLIWRHHQLMIRQQLAASNLTFTEDDTSSSNYSNHFTYFNYFTPYFTTQYYFILFILYIQLVLLCYYNFNFSILHLHFISCVYLKYCKAYWYCFVLFIALYKK